MIHFYLYFFSYVIHNRYMARPKKYKYEGVRNPYSIRLTEQEVKMIKTYFGSVQNLVQSGLDEIKDSKKEKKNDKDS